MSLITLQNYKKIRGLYLFLKKKNPTQKNFTTFTRKFQM
jgi:hypothetical protein